MVSLPVYDRTGAEVGQFEVDPSQIAPRISKQLMHDAVVMYQANRRQGSAKTRSRAEISGSTRKMYRQKGTGNARAGSRRSGVRRGGGHIFAIRPRDYSYRLPKKAVRLATRMAVASRILDEEVTLIDELTFAEPKTREMAAILTALDMRGDTLLVAVERYDVNIYKSIRNLPGVSVLPVAELNTLDVLRPQRMLMTRSALESLCGSSSGAVAGGALSEPSLAVEAPAAETAAGAAPAGEPEAEKPADETSEGAE